MANLLPDIASVDCWVASLALAAGDVRTGVRLLARAALLLRVRAGGVEAMLDRRAAARAS